MKLPGGQPTAPRRYRMVARAQAAEATGQRILESAEQHFGELLYDQVSLKSVADGAGVTVQTVIRRFGSKEGLFAALARWRSGQIQRGRDRVPAGDMPGAIRNLVESYERWGKDQLHLLAQEQRTEAIADVVRSGRCYHHGWVKRVFAPWLDDLAPSERRRRTAQLVAVTDVYLWKVLQQDVGLNRRETESTLRELAERLLAVNAPTPRSA